MYTYNYLKEISDGLNFTDTNRPSRFSEGIIEVRNGEEEPFDNDNLQRWISKIEKKVLNNSNMPPPLKTKVKDYIATILHYDFGYQLVKLEHRGTNPSWGKEEVKAIVPSPQPLADITNHHCALPCNPNLPDKTIHKKHIWSEEEHKLLLSAIQLYGTQWTKNCRSCQNQNPYTSTNLCK